MGRSECNYQYPATSCLTVPAAWGIPARTAVPCIPSPLAATHTDVAAAPVPAQHRSQLYAVVCFTGYVQLSKSAFCKFHASIRFASPQSCTTVCACIEPQCPAKCCTIPPERQTQSGAPKAALCSRTGVQKHPLPLHQPFYLNSSNHTCPFCQPKSGICSSYSKLWTQSWHSPGCLPHVINASLNTSQQTTTDSLPYTSNTSSATPQHSSTVCLPLSCPSNASLYTSQQCPADSFPHTSNASLATSQHSSPVSVSCSFDASLDASQHSTAVPLPCTPSTSFYTSQHIA